MAADTPDDWIRDNKTGKITWNVSVTSKNNTPEGFDYIGANDQNIVSYLFGNSRFSATTKDIGIMGMEEYKGSSAAYHFSATTKLRVDIKAKVEYGKDGSRVFEGVYLDASINGRHSRPHDKSIGLGGSFNIQGFIAGQENYPRGVTEMISAEGSVNNFGSAFFSAKSIQNNFGKSTYLNVSYKGIYGHYSGQSSWNVLTYPTAVGAAIPNYTNVKLKIPMNQRVYTPIKH